MILIYTFSEGMKTKAGFHPGEGMKTDLGFHTLGRQSWYNNSTAFPRHLKVRSFHTFSYIFHTQGGGLRAKVAFQAI